MWRALIEDVGATSRRGDGLTCLWADSAFGFYNAISFGDPGVDQATFAARLDAARSFMGLSDRNGFLWVFEEMLTSEARERADEIASSSGFERAMTCYGMAGDLSPLREPEHPSLSFQRVSTPDHLAAYASLNARAYGWSRRTRKGP